MGGRYGSLGTWQFMRRVNLSSSLRDFTIAAVIFGSLLLGASELTPIALGQLYLVTGTQTTRTTAAFSSELWRVGIDGGLQPVAAIASKETGLFWIEISYEARVMAAITRKAIAGEEESAVVVVDFDKGNIVKRCLVPLSPRNLMGIEEWLANIPGKGLAVVDRLEAFAAPTDKDELIRAMLLDHSIPCNSSFEMVAPSDSTAIIANGRAGVAGIAANETVVFGMDSDGRIFRRFRGGQIVNLGYQVPASLRGGVEHPGFSVMINNAQVLVAIVGGTGVDNVFRVLAFRKSDQTWHRVPNPSDLYPFGRSFGHFLAFPEAHLKSPTLLESAGRAEWGKKESTRGPSVAEVFQDSRLAYPGMLHLYDIDTGRNYVIDTKQGDSEVLLVENNTVYYRASDRLYSAPITETGIGTSRLIATDEAIRDAHWAFIKH
jgi:hypothetical protein